MTKSRREQSMDELPRRQKGGDSARCSVGCGGKDRRASEGGDGEADGGGEDRCDPRGEWGGDDDTQRRQISFQSQIGEEE